MGKESDLKTAYIATGTEGAGTHMLRDFLVAAGCHWRQDDERHKENYAFDEVEYPFVFHRSIPHSGAYPDFLAVNHEFQRAGVFPWYLLIVREFNAVRHSVARRHKFDPKKYNHSDYQRYSVRWVGRFIDHDTGFDLITYEAFCLQEGYRRWLVDRWGLTYPEDFEIKFGNLKYYE